MNYSVPNNPSIAIFSSVARGKAKSDDETITDSFLDQQQLFINDEFKKGYVSADQTAATLVVKWQRQKAAEAQDQHTAVPEKSA